MEGIKGIFATHIEVTSLEQAKKFYGDILGLKLGWLEAEQRAAFYRLDQQEQSMIALWEKDFVHPVRVSFQIERADIEETVSMLKHKYIRFKGQFGYSEDEPVVYPWCAKASVLFEDPDGNLIELVARLTDKPRKDMNEFAVSLSEWKNIHCV